MAIKEFPELICLEDLKLSMILTFGTIHLSNYLNIVKALGELEIDTDELENLVFDPLKTFLRIPVARAIDKQDIEELKKRNPKF